MAQQQDRASVIDGWGMAAQANVPHTTKILGPDHGYCDAF